MDDMGIFELLEMKQKGFDLFSELTNYSLGVTVLDEVMCEGCRNGGPFANE